MLKELCHKFTSGLARLFRRRKPKPAHGLTDSEVASLLYGTGSRKPVRTSRGGPNMPKSQPCHVCHRDSKRAGKATTGASYRCGTHGPFFVKGAYESRLERVLANKGRRNV